MDGDIITGIEEFTNASIELSPNPSDGTLQMRLPKSLQNATITLFTLDGKRVFSEQRNISENEILAYDFKKLSSGLYLITISSGTKMYTGKWIKQ